MNPYTSLPERAFWAPAVGKRNMLDISELWVPRFRITAKQPVATFGSCFAQHFGWALHASGYEWLDTEPAPEGLSAANAKRFNFGVFTCRTGNIYTPSLLGQWLSWAAAETTPPEITWEQDGRYYDPFRPGIEPDGFLSSEELFTSRLVTVRALRKAVETARVFVFTLGLTESWFDLKHNVEYPMCPGTVAGSI